MQTIDFAAHQTFFFRNNLSTSKKLCRDSFAAKLMRVLHTPHARVSNEIELFSRILRRAFLSAIPEVLFYSPEALNFTNF